MTLTANNEESRLHEYGYAVLLIFASTTVSFHILAAIMWNSLTTGSGVHKIVVQLSNINLLTQNLPVQSIFS